MAFSSAFPGLVRLFRDDDSPDVRSQIALALGRRVGLDPGRASAPLEEIGRKTGGEAPADAANLASWLAIQNATGR